MFYFFIGFYCCYKGGKKRNLMSGQHAALAGVEQTIPYAGPSVEGENLCHH